MSKDEIGWVIERHIHNKLHYWTGRPESMLGQWTRAHGDAMRFSRREDAMAMLTWHCDSIGRVVEHLWAMADEGSPTS